MKKILLLVVIFAIQTTCASATISTVTFSGADILAYSTSVNPTTTPVVGDGRVDFDNDALSIGTYQRANTDVSSTNFNSWIDGLGSDEGISSFNLWLQDGASNQAAMWGESIALTDAFDSNIDSFASSGWTASVYTVGTEWGSYWEGRNLITYTANSIADYLRYDSTATFGFTADIMGIGNAIGPDYQMWVGSNDIVSNSGANFFQRAVTATAAPVPEPATFILLGSGLAGLAFYRRKRK